MSRMKVPFLLLGMFLVNVVVFIIVEREQISQKKSAKDEAPQEEFSSEVFNHYEQKEGLFSLDHRNDFVLRESQGIYYLKHLKSGRTAFQIFEDSPALNFPKDQYACENGLCYSTATPETIVRNIKILKPEDRQGDDYQYLTRAEALRWILDSKFLNRDFSNYGTDCFTDIQELSLADSICFAKTQDIVVGIGTEFFPNSSINLAGFLKMIFGTYDVDFNAPKLSEEDQDFFELMTAQNFYYPLLSNAFEEGLFLNESGEDIWPNRNLYRWEAEIIFQRFIEWQEGKIFRDSNRNENFQLKPNLEIKDPNRHFEFEIEKKDGDFTVHPNRKTKWRMDGNMVKLYALEEGGFWEYIMSFETAKPIQNIQLEYSPENFKAQLKIFFEGGQSQELKWEIQEGDFAYLKDGSYKDLDNDYLLPHRAQMPRSITPQIQFYLSDRDFKRLNENRTVDTQYPAFMEIQYPNGEVEIRSVLLKTRGNASRGYVKSSYSIDSFHSFDENKDFDGDEFLQGEKNLKLRSLIGDEEYFTEKLMYRAFEALGYLAPHFFETVVTVNGVDMGFFQATEAVTDDFFERRGPPVENYYFSQNMATPYGGNLKYFKDDATTLSHYEIHGDERALLDFIHGLDKNDPALLKQIDIQNIFDTALFVWSHNLHDSVFANFYLYQDEEKKWKLFLWDTDNGLDDLPPLTKEEFKDFLNLHEGRFNNLFYYLSKHISDADFDLYWDDYWARYQNNTDLPTWLGEYLQKYGDLVDWDNKLWNGIHFERKVTIFQSKEAIAGMREKLDEVKNFLQR